MMTPDNETIIVDFGLQQIRKIFFHNFFITSFSEYLKNDGLLLKELNEDHHHLFPIVLSYQSRVDPEKFEKITNRIKEFYFQSRSIAAETDIEVVKVNNHFIFSLFLRTIVLVILNVFNEIPIGYISFISYVYGSTYTYILICKIHLPLGELIKREN